MQNIYEVAAMAMRYVFAALMVLIVLRGWRITVIDSRRATKLRRLSPQTGIIGEMLVTDGGERARTGMRYPVTLEGTIGSARRADIRVRHGSVRARHAFYMMTDEGLFVRGHAGARLSDAEGGSARELVLHDGDEFSVGRVQLMLVLSEGDSAPEEIVRRVRRRRSVEEARRAAERDETDFPDAHDALFDVPAEDFSDPGSLFESNPAGNFDTDGYVADGFDEDGFDEDDTLPDEFSAPPRARLRREDYREGRKAPRRKAHRHRNF